MEGYIDENRWIDLSGLPRTTYGNKTRIDWKNSIGHEVPFKYNQACGNIQIIDHKLINSGDSVLLITIDKYVSEPYQIYATSFLHGKIKHLVANRIIDVKPELVQYLANEQDAYKYNIHNKSFIQLRCPFCGSLFDKEVYVFCKNGFVCDVCHDGISAPNKIMRCILEQCGVNFIAEVSKKHGFTWMGPYKYDFYCKLQNGKNVLIEMDGRFHDLEEQQKRDKIKNTLAKQNCFNLIRIDCKYGANDAISYIKDKILHSDLATLLPIDVIDWDTCRLAASKRVMIEACVLWEHDGLSVCDISKRLNLSSACLAVYLQKGYSLGLCPSYNKKEVRIRSNHSRAKPILVKDDNDVKYIFKNVHHAEEELTRIYGATYYYKSIHAACKRKTHYYKGLYFWRISKEEYEQYKMIFNDNNEVVKEEIYYDITL